MKNCPVCKLDYADDFSYCEFDGALLEKVKQEKRGLPSISALPLRQRRFQMIAFGIALSLITLYIFGKAIPARKITAVRSAEIVAHDTSPYYQTPQAAQDYVDERAAESPNDAGQERQSRHNDAPEKPGVSVTIPGLKPARGSESGRETKAQDEAPPPVKTEPPSSPKSRRPANQSEMGAQPAAQDIPAQSRPRFASRPNEDLPVQPSGGTGSVNMSLVRVRSFKTESGVRYDLTLTMQQLDGRVIRWDRLNLLTHSQSGIQHTEVVPFNQRLGASGSMSFTVSVEMRGRADSDWQGRISCTGVGTDVEGRNVKASFSTRVTP